MATSFTQFQTDFAKFQGDFSTFVSNVQTALQQLTSAGGLTPEQQTALNTIDAAVNAMDTTVQGITFPAPPAPGS